MRCKELKSNTSFYKNKARANGLTSWCKECISEVKKKNYPRNKKKSNAQSKAWREKLSKEERQARDYYYWRLKLLKSHGISLDQYNEMLALQENKCAICKVEFPPITQRIEKRQYMQVAQIDHDHDTGKVRGLLCGNCNGGLGRLKDDIELLESAIDYLKIHTNESKELGG